MIHSNQIAKLGLGILGTSTLVGSSFGIHSALQDKTIEHSVIRNGKELIDKKEVFEVAFKQHRGEKEFLELINVTNDAIDLESLDKAGVALSSWCNTNRKVSLTDKKAKGIIPKVEKYCTKPFTTIKERIDKLGKKLVSNWKEKVQTIKGYKEDDKTLKDDLEAVVSGVTANNGNQKADVWGVALNSWCGTNINTLLVKDRDDTIFKKIEERCVEEKIQ